MKIMSELVAYNDLLNAPDPPIKRKPKPQKKSLSKAKRTYQERAANTLIASLRRGFLHWNPHMQDSESGFMKIDFGLSKSDDKLFLIEPVACGVSIRGQTELSEHCNDERPAVFHFQDRDKLAK